MRSILALRASEASEAATIAAAVEQHGWPAGFEACLPRLTRARTHELHEELWLRHTGWKGLFAPEARRTALVVESGYGSATISLAQDFDRVFSWIPDESQRGTARARAGALEVANAIFLDDLEALPPVTIDAAVIYGFDDRTAASLLKDRPGFDQLGPAGAVFVGVRRPSGRVRRLVRALTLVDPAGALGRDVASEGGRTQTHCYSGDLTRASEWRAVDRSEPWWRQWGDLVRAPAMSFVGWRNPRARSLFDRVFDSAQERCRDAWGGGGRLSVTQQFFSNPEGATFVCSYGGRALILRVPLNDRTADRFKRNYEALGAMSAAGFGTSIAHPLFAGRVGDRPYFAESVVGGEPLRTHVTKGNARAVDEAIEWITQVHAATAHRQPLKGTWLTDRVSAPVRKAFRFLGRTDLEPVCQRMHLFLEGQLAHRPLPLVRAHGDFSIDNVRVSPDGRMVTGVFDWDLSAGAGLPFLDLCYLLASAEAHRRREPLGHSLARLLTQLEAGDRVSAAVSRYRMTLGLPEHLMFPLGLLTWVYHVAFRIENLEPYRWPHLMADVVEPILPILERRLEAARRSA